MRASTKAGAVQGKFEQIANKYGLSLQDEWNYLSSNPIRHQGRHPWNYHNWVYENMTLADDAAGVSYPDPADAELRRSMFLDLFRRWVYDVVKADPTITRAGYWKCRSYYRWS